MEFGIVQYFGSYGKEKCSYCKSKKETSNSVGMNTYNISEHSYQLLIDRGWRRSGSYCYKMGKTDCCAFYTIRCDALKFELTRSKRKLLKKMNKFLQSPSLDRTLSDMNAKASELKRTSHTIRSMDHDHESSDNANQRVDFNLNNITADAIKPTITYKQATGLTAKTLADRTNQSSPIDIARLKQSNKRKCKRMLKRIDKLKTRHSCTDEDAIRMMIQNRKSNKIVHSKLSLEDHSDLEKCLTNQLKIRIVLATRESGRVSHELYKKYQKIIHKSEEHELDFHNFERFLISNPFRKNKPQPEWRVPDDQLPDRYGCYHMQYWLNDKLIAVNVIDILTNCVSSVYFFYDPDYQFLNLGTYSSLREIELVRKLHKHNPSIKYYYLGFYIHSCVKMRYKGNIDSSYLLCPETYVFHDYKWCNANFDLNKFCRLTPDPQAIDADGIVNVDDVRVLYKESAMTYKMYKMKTKSKSTEPGLGPQEIEEYARLVGNKFIFKNLLFLH